MYGLAPQTNNTNVNLDISGKKNRFSGPPAFNELGFIVAEHVRTRTSLMRDPLDRSMLNLRFWHALSLFFCFVFVFVFLCRITYYTML